MGERPLIAISEGFADYGDYHGVAYPRPVLAAGGFPVLLPYLERHEDRVEALQRADGLVLAGGRDIEPARYGRRVPSRHQLAPSWLLDDIELDLARLAVQGGVPVLGICRGIQILNVAFGGTLYGDLEEFPEMGADHPGAKWEEWRALVAATLANEVRPPHPTHPVDIRPGSVLAEQLGEHAVVDSYHHQAIRDLGIGIVDVAWAPHGVVEAIEVPEAPAFVLGVQWELHEEWQDDASTLGIWRAFVQAAGARKEARAAVEAIA